MTTRMKHRQGLADISLALRTARRTNGYLNTYPGAIPQTMDEAYRIQSESIAAWPDRIGGWKVGGVAPDLQQQYGAQRLAGPVFSKTIHHATNADLIEIPAFRGFVAIEAEWVFKLGEVDYQPGQALTLDDVAGMVCSCHIGVELASSPLDDINSFGPAVIASDFGNNHGLVIGANMEDWSSDALSHVTVSVDINGQTVGSSPARRGLDGPLGAIKFLIEHLTARGADDLTGLYVSTGAITGVHATDIGASSIARFNGVGEIAIKVGPIDPIQPPQVSA